MTYSLAPPRPLTPSRFNRRHFLRAAGVTLALPILESVGASAVESAESPRRMVCVCTTLGIHAENLFPQQPGRDYALTSYLDPLHELRNDFTLFSGVSHPGVDGGHSSEASFLTAAPHPGASSFRNTISLDQFTLEKLPPATRFGCLVLNTGNGGTSISYSRSGTMLPADNRPSLVFQRLFVTGTPAEIAKQTRRLQDGQSIMDTVGREATLLRQRASTRDRERLEEYFTTVREVEQRLHLAEEWTNKPKPQVEAKPPADIPNHADFVSRTRRMLDLIQLALETDSTRVVTLNIQGHNSIPPIDGVTQDWHNLSHHGQDPEKLAQLRVVELEQMKLLAGFLTKLKGTRETDATLLDRTMVLYGSNLGNASNHDTRNMPVLLAGGGFRHGQYLAFDQQRNTPLPQLYVAMLQRLGIDCDQFGSGQGRISGLERA